MSFFQGSSSAMVDQNYQAVSSCDKQNHFHTWPTTGELEIERCEHYCLYCRGPKALKKWSSAWFLRRHVRETHAKTEFPSLQVSEGWSKRPTGNTRPLFKKQRAPGSNKKRSGTKRDRAALMRAFQEGNTISCPSELDTGSQHMRAPTDAMTNHASFLSADHPTCPYAWEVDLPEHLSNGWMLPSSDNQQSIDPKSTDLFSTADSMLGADMFDFDGYTADPSVADSGIGSSIVTAASTTDDVAHATETKQCVAPSSCNFLNDADVEFGELLRAAIAQPVESDFNVPMDDSSFEQMFTGGQFADYHPSNDLQFDQFITDPFFADFGDDV